MMSHQTFRHKWENIVEKHGSDEFSIFVPPGGVPRTQRQFNLYHYHEFIASVISGKGYTEAIEIGCGRGTMSLYLTLYDRLKLVCCDSERSAIELAQKNFKHFGASAEFMVADAASLPLPDASVDVSVSIGLLEHFEDYRAVLSEQHRILRPGGVLISLNIPRKHSVQDLNAAYRKIVRFFKPAAPLKPDYFRNGDRPEQYLGAARNAGFIDAYIVNVNPFPLFTPLSRRAEHFLTALYRLILILRKPFMWYPFRTAYPISQAHFLVGYKK